MVLLWNTTGKYKIFQSWRPIVLIEQALQRKYFYERQSLELLRHFFQ